MLLLWILRLNTLEYKNRLSLKPLKGMASTPRPFYMGFLPPPPPPGSKVLRTLDRFIQQIVTLSKYGRDALDICHP